jgi:hypothetical protein|uniref:Uncharacterized protein n=1 Tax=viral metagenome TaxID=1070528 RepID=A0A6C0E6B3_9ZZZZ
MDLLKKRQEKDQKNQLLVQQVLKDSQVNRYKFGSLNEMVTIRNLSLKKILNGKINSNEDKNQVLQILELLNEYFYVEELDQLDSGDYLRYFSFKTDNSKISFELKKGGYYVSHENGFIILKNLKYASETEKPTYWKISDQTPIFCLLTDQDKIILALMEKTSYQD